MNFTSYPSLVWLLFLLSGGLISASGQSTADVVEFDVAELGQIQHITITHTADFVRVDLPREKWSVIYRIATQTYVGLEHRDARYWEFSWPEIEAAAQKSKRAGERFRDLLGEGLSSYNEPAQGPNNMGLPRAPRYRWSQGEAKKVVTAYNTQQWVGQGALADNVEAWCTDQKIPALQVVLEKMKPMNEPLALAAVRPALPPQVFLIFDSLIKAEVTPVAMVWGKAPDFNSCTFIRASSKPVEPTFFVPPSRYTKTDLIALEGLLKEVE